MLVTKQPLLRRFWYPVMPMDHLAQGPKPFRLLGVDIALWLAPDGAAWYEWRWPQRVFELALLCVVGVAVYFASLWLLGTRMSHLRAPAAH